jgi:glycosyltransferase involved in cell wall biosynthesis
VRIAVDLSAVATAGTRSYAGGFGPAFLQEGSRHELRVFSSRATWALISGGRQPPNVTWDEVTFPHTAVRIWWEQTILPWKLWRWRADVCFSPFDTAPIAAPCPVLLAVRNPMPTVAVSRRQNAAGLLSRARVQFVVARAACRKAARVFFPTAFASDMLGTALDVPDHKRAVVFHGTDRDFWMAPGGPLTDRLGLTAGRYFLFVSRLYPQKRADLLVEAYARWRAAHHDGPGSAPWRLMIVGSHISPDRADAFATRVRELGVEHEVTFASDLARDELRALYQNCAAFVLPTEMETFGQPFVEAMTAGAPIIAADRGFARELCQDAAVYFPAGDAGALTAALEALSTDTGARRAMIDRGRQRCQAFSWTREAAETLQLLESCIPS